MSNRGFAALTLLLAAGLAGCGSAPIPLAAHPGQSFTLFLTGEYLAGVPWEPSFVGNNVGFGGAFYWNASTPLIDVQRGEIEFYLEDGPVAGAVLLTTQIATRVVADPASGTAIGSGATGLPGGLANLGVAQVMAVVAIPPGTTPGLYTLRVRKVIRSSGSDDDPQAFPFPLTYAQPLEVIPGDYEPNLSELFLAGLSSTNPSQLKRIYPNPKVLVNFGFTPAAAHLEIGIPETQLDVLSVIEEQHYGRQSLVQWSVEGDLLTVDFVNLEVPLAVDELAIVYGPKPGYVRIHDAPELGAPANPIDQNFTLLAEQYWDSEGNPIPTPLGAVWFGPIR